MEAVTSFETSVIIYQTTSHKMPEDIHIQKQMFGQGTSSTALDHLIYGRRLSAVEFVSPCITTSYEMSSSD
jgi:hypothetical protein